METAKYSSVTIASEPRIPIGIERCGRFVSSAVVATMSKPTIANAFTEPPSPGGAVIASGRVTPATWSSSALR